MDLTADLTPPKVGTQVCLFKFHLWPKDVMVEVIALEDCGEVMTESGVVSRWIDASPSVDFSQVNLEKGTTHSLRRRDVESLIRQGLLRELRSQEAV